ncbi:MAG: DUF2520 domain-containing protein [Cyclobacteriaceae bacterium]
MRITLIGTGNVASHLAPILEQAGHSIGEVYGRSIEKAEAICNNLYDPRFAETLDFNDSKSDVFIIAVSDNAIESICSDIVLPDEAILVHTSGSVAMEVLELSAAETIGVFYPLQTFTKGRQLNLAEVPLLIESNSDEGMNVLSALGSSLSENVHQAESEIRSKIHVAAVMVNNFTNHILVATQDYAGQQGVEFDLLVPLLKETITKALNIGPINSQTGPATREDYQTIEKHISLLENNEELQKLYKMLTQSIIDYKYK